MKRAIIVVIDSMGVGAMPDHKDYNDVAECNTLGNVAKAVNGLNIPNLQKMGLGNIIDCDHQFLQFSKCDNIIFRPISTV